MYHKIKLATLGLGLLLSVFAMGSCGTDPDTVLLEQALATPTLAIKSNGQSLEAYEGETEEIDGALFLLREAKVYDEETDVEHTIPIAWEVKEGTEDYWSPFREKTSIPNLVDNTNVYLANPIRPSYGEDNVETALIATATLNEKSVSKEFPITLLAETVDLSEVPLLPLDTVTPPAEGPRDAYGSFIVRMRGYLTRNMLDWDSAYIHNGNTGINLYKLSLSPDLLAVITVGDYLEVMGSFALYAGMRQLSYITRVTPAPIDETAIEPVATVIEEADWAGLVSGRDGSLAHVEGLTYDAAASGEVTLGGHATLFMKLGDVSVKVYLNYHNDLAGTTTRRQVLLDTFQAAVEGATVTFEGVLGWYNGPQLLPIPVEDVTLVPAA